VGDSLQLEPSFESAWRRLPEDFRAEWESILQEHVQRFRARRSSRLQFCPNDGCQIPTIQELRMVRGGPRVVAWCQDCQAGFLFAFDADYGWEHCTSLTWSEGRWALNKRYSTDAHHEEEVYSFEDLTTPPPL